MYMYFDWRCDGYHWRSQFPGRCLQWGRYFDIDTPSGTSKEFHQRHAYQLLDDSSLTLIHCSGNEMCLSTSHIAKQGKIRTFHLCEHALQLFRSLRKCASHPRPMWCTRRRLDQWTVTLLWSKHKHHTTWSSSGTYATNTFTSHVSQMTLCTISIR